ncbi:hypothetical protein QW131_31550 [Roseibium salinum]|nr:hypothetical protein [Roseibium salinum]
MGSITDDFNGDGMDDTVSFTLTFDTIADTYDLQFTTPPTTISTFDTSQGALAAGGPDAVRTLAFPPAGHDNDVIFFGAVATAPLENGTVGGDPNDLEDLVENDPTEATLEGLNVPNLINANTKMNVSTSGIGINNNNLDGADEGAGTGLFAGTSITSGDESFVVNPEQDVDAVRVYIDNSVGGYDPDSEDLYYVVYYTDGTVSGPTDVTAVSPVPKSDPADEWPDVAQGGTYFDIDGGEKADRGSSTHDGLGDSQDPGNRVHCRDGIRSGAA